MSFLKVQGEYGNREGPSVRKSKHMSQNLGQTQNKLFSINPDVAGNPTWYDPHQPKSEWKKTESETFMCNWCVDNLSDGYYNQANTYLFNVLSYQGTMLVRIVLVPTQTHTPVFPFTFARGRRKGGARSCAKLTCEALFCNWFACMCAGIAIVRNPTFAHL